MCTAGKLRTVTRHDEVGISRITRIEYEAYIFSIRPVIFPLKRLERSQMIILPDDQAEITPSCLSL